MKKAILAVTFLAFTGSGVFAQELLTKAQVQKENKTETTINFKETSHDFGKLKEGDAAIAEFAFKNTGDKPLIIQNVRPSCGCTTPYWSKDPINPGKGRPGAFNKSITVTSNAGKEVLYIKGIVEKGPAASAPENSSMMKK